MLFTQYFIILQTIPNNHGTPSIQLSFVSLWTLSLFSLIVDIGNNVSCFTCYSLMIIKCIFISHQYFTSTYLFVKNCELSKQIYSHYCKINTFWVKKDLGSVLQIQFRWLVKFVITLVLPILQWGDYKSVSAFTSVHPHRNSIEPY